MIAMRGIRILGIVVLVSVAFNLFLAGNLLGRRVRGPTPPLTFDQRIDAIWRGLPEADQPVARDIIEAHRAQIMARWLALRPAAQHATATVRTTPYMPDEAKASFESLNDRNQALRQAIQDAVIEVAGKISPEGRKELRFPGGP
jgi:uncharacterized membrane protein